MIESKASATPARRGTDITAATILVMRTIPEGRTGDEIHAVVRRWDQLDRFGE